MATTETHDIVIRWQQQGQQAVVAEADTIKKTYAGIGPAVQKSLSSAASSLKSSLTGVSTLAKQAGAIMSASITAPLVLMAKNSIGAASDLNESMSAVKTVFGEAADAVVTFSQTTATSFGITQTEALTASTRFAGFGATIGLNQTQLADFSEKLITAAADLGSFYNADPSDMLDRLRSGLSGESEPLKAFNFNLSDAAVKAKALELGLGDVNGVLTEGEKIQARYALILSQMGPAAGDAARTIDQFAGSQRVLAAEIQELSATIGTLLLPYAQQLVNVLKNAVTWVNNLSPWVKDLAVKIALVAAAAGPVLLVLGSMAPVLATVGAAVATAIGALASLPVAAALAAVVGLYVAFQRNFLGIRDIVTNVVDRIGEYIGRVVEFFTHARDRGLDPFRLAMRTLIVTLAEQFGGGNPVVEFLQGILRNGERLATYITNTLIPTFGALFTALQGGDFTAAGDILGSIADDLQGGWDKTVGPWIDDRVAEFKAFPATLLQAISTGFSQINWDLVGSTLNTQGSALIAALQHGAQDLWNNTFSPWLASAIASLQGLFQAAGTWLTTSGADLMTGLQHGMQEYWNTTLSPWLHSAIDAIGPLFHSAVMTLGQAGVDLIVSLQHGMQDFWNNHLAGWLQSAADAIGPLFHDAVMTVGQAAVDLIVAFQHGLQDTWNNDLAPWLQSAVDAIGPLVSSATIAVGQAGVDLIVALQHGAQDVWNNELGPWLTSAIAAIPGLFADAATWLVQAGTDLVAGLQFGAQDTWNNQLGPWLQSAVAAIPGLFADAGTWLAQAGTDLIAGFQHGAQDLWNNQVGPWVSGLSGDIQNAFAGAGTWLTNAGAALIDGLRHGAQDLWNNQVAGWFTGLQGNLQGAFNNAATWLVNAGQSIIGGLLGGITRFWDTTIAPWFKTIGTAIQNALPKVADLQKILYDEGQAVAQGLVDGASATLKTFVDTFTKAIHDLQSALDVFVGNANKAAANAPKTGSGGGGGGFGDGTNPKDHTHDIGGARGLVSQARRWAWVGEAGPELVKLPGGAMVIPHMASMSRAASFGAHAMASGGVVMRGDVPLRRMADPATDPLASVVVYGNVTINPPNADVASEIARQFQTRNR